MSIVVPLRTVRLGLLDVPTLSSLQNLGDVEIDSLLFGSDTDKVVVVVRVDTFEVVGCYAIH
jgi:hypothetical protein